MSSFGKDVGKCPLSKIVGECMSFVICRKVIGQYLSIKILIPYEPTATFLGAYCVEILAQAGKIICIMIFSTKGFW